MAKVLSVDMKGGKILLNLSISKDEYRVLDSATKDILVLSTETLSESLTTGKLGHSNRIMLPKKVLKKHGMDSLPKKAPADIFDLIDSKFLVIKVEDKKIGVPRFGDKYAES